MQVYLCKDGRTRMYDPDTKKVTSYPRYLMEQKLGRSLRHNEDVHHLDNNPLNNDLSNLEVRLRGEHQREHSTKYHDKTMTCSYCGKEFIWTAHQQKLRAANAKRPGRHESGLVFCSRKCSGSYGRELQLKAGVPERHRERA